MLTSVANVADNESMFVREKTARGHTYLDPVESEREGGRIRQRIIHPLGRKDGLMATGELDRLVASLVRHCDCAMILSDMAGRIACTRISGPPLFGHLWKRLGIAEELSELLADRSFEFAVERPSLPACCTGCLYRALTAAARNGWPITGSRALPVCRCTPSIGRWPGSGRRSRPPRQPRCLKDLIEERLFERRRDLFSDRSLVSMDTTRTVLSDPESGMPRPAGLIIEVVQGEGGVIPASRRFKIDALVPVSARRIQVIRAVGRTEKSGLAMPLLMGRLRTGLSHEAVLRSPLINGSF